VTYGRSILPYVLMADANNIRKREKMDIHRYIGSNPSESDQFDMYRQLALVQHLLRGKSIPDLQSEMDMRNTGFISNTFSVVESYIEVFDNKGNNICASMDIYEWRRLRYALRIRIEEILGDGYQIFIVDGEQGYTSVLCTRGSGADVLAKIRSAFNRMSEDISELEDIMFTSAVSNIVCGYSEISSAYKQARELLEYLLYNDIYGTYCYTDSEISDTADEVQDYAGMLMKLRPLLFAGNLPEAAQLIERFCLALEINESLVRTRYRFGMLIETTLELLESLCLVYPSVLTSARCEELLECTTIGQYKRVMGELLSELGCVGRKDMGFSVIRTDAIINFINSRFSDSNLSVGLIADYFDLTSATISRLISERTGMTALKYIHMLRISEAKRLISQTGQSIADIANEVGYINPLSFYRIFKKSEGVSPSDYRFIAGQIQIAQDGRVKFQTG
jgi:AraC-like DNA-binding protein